ncbi:HesA/MoeB/ThiF family protein [Candidatus Magnetaquicoccus inordinatus]|uniref:HesA/MoeB/ThiF family protein n=1 Tax=Candidatus Magnetaquicoccus inordinatus TaxID=2496818 RepID=UPI00187D41EB|nr:HesA/MoeB/ThiF family protein [Candidatus Magnetaquicoccus inordinatus]
MHDSPETETKGSVLLLGAGGLGSAVAWALAGSGIARLGIVDDDTVALSNLHRQILYRVRDLGKAKVAQAAERLQQLYPALQIEIHAERLQTRESIAARASGYDLLIDGTDNFCSRFAANDAAVLDAIPLVHGAAIGLRGQLCFIPPGGQPCLRCLFDTPPPQEGSCRSEGVWGALVGEVGWLMALEASKWLRGVGEPLQGRLLTIDLESSRRRIVTWKVHPTCPVCQLASGSLT